MAAENPAPPVTRTLRMVKMPLIELETPKVRLTGRISGDRFRIACQVQYEFQVVLVAEIFLFHVRIRS